MYTEKVFDFCFHGPVEQRSSVTSHHTSGTVVIYLDDQNQSGNVTSGHISRSVRAETQQRAQHCEVALGIESFCQRSAHSRLKEQNLAFFFCLFYLL